MNNLKKIHVYLCAVLGILINLIYAGLFFMEIITGYVFAGEMKIVQSGYKKEK
jgi:hypothetical protein